MSKYTTEVRYICETLAGYSESQGLDKVAEIIAEARPKIFDFDYPIFDSNYKSVLETKILRHYYTREISEETVGLWKLRLNDKMNMIMPYYNKLYNSELIEFDPMFDTNLTRDHVGQRADTDINNKTNTAQNTETTNAQNARNVTKQNNGGYTDNSGAWDMYSDTPQGGITGIENAQSELVDMAYLTNARRNTGSMQNSHNDTDTEAENSSVSQTVGNNGTSTEAVRKDFTSTDNYLEHITGKQGTQSYSKMLEEFRNTFLNIDKMIIEELSTLFFGLWW